MRDEVFGQYNRLKAIFRFADHFQIGFEFQNFFKLPADSPVVVRQQDNDSHHDVSYASDIDA
jgi:hypothetical protein